MRSRMPVSKTVLIHSLPRSELSAAISEPYSRVGGAYTRPGGVTVRGMKQTACEAVQITHTLWSPRVLQPKWVTSNGNLSLHRESRAKAESSAFWTTATKGTSRRPGTRNQSNRRSQRTSTSWSSFAKTCAPGARRRRSCAERSWQRGCAPFIDAQRASSRSARRQEVPSAEEVRILGYEDVRSAAAGIRDPGP